jgi:hypothetical protein
MSSRCNRRQFIEQAAVIGGATGLAHAWGAEPVAIEPEPLRPLGKAKGIHPGRVVWVHDPGVSQWQGPGNGRIYEAEYTNQGRADQMMSHAVCELTGQPTVASAWGQLFRYLNQARGKGPVPYAPGEKIVIKPNWVGMIWREGAVDPEQYTLIKRQDYMNTSPHMIIALLRQLTGAAGVRAGDISVCDSLAYLVHEYYLPLAHEFPDVAYWDFAGKFGRLPVRPSSIPLYWSCRPQDVSPDFIPQCFADAEYVVNFAQLKAHTATGVTLCGKNHFGSLVRWPVQQGYYDMHRNSFRKQTGADRDYLNMRN